MVKLALVLSLSTASLMAAEIDTSAPHVTFLRGRRTNHQQGGMHRWSLPRRGEGQEWIQTLPAWIRSQVRLRGRCSTISQDAASIAPIPAVA